MLGANVVRLPCIKGLARPRPGRFDLSLAPALRRAGLRAIRIHDARDTFAFIRPAAGINPATLSKRLGHSNVAVTHAIYTHAIESAEDGPSRSGD